MSSLAPPEPEIDYDVFFHYSLEQKFNCSEKKTKDWALVQNAALAIDVNGVEVRLGWET